MHVGTHSHTHLQPHKNTTITETNNTNTHTGTYKRYTQTLFYFVVKSQLFEVREENNRVAVVVFCTKLKKKNWKRESAIRYLSLGRRL